MVPFGSHSVFLTRIDPQEQWSPVSCGLSFVWRKLFSFDPFYEHRKMLSRYRSPEITVLQGFRPDGKCHPSESNVGKQPLGHDGVGKSKKPACHFPREIKTSLISSYKLCFDPPVKRKWFSLLEALGFYLARL